MNPQQQQLALAHMEDMGNHVSSPIKPTETVALASDIDNIIKSRLQTMSQEYKHEATALRKENAELKAQLAAANKKIVLLEGAAEGADKVRNEERQRMDRALQQAQQKAQEAKELVQHAKMQAADWERRATFAETKLSNQEREREEFRRIAQVSDEQRYKAHPAHAASSGGKNVVGMQLNRIDAKVSALQSSMEKSWRVVERNVDEDKDDDDSSSSSSEDESEDVRPQPPARRHVAGGKVPRFAPVQEGERVVYKKYGAGKGRWVVEKLRQDNEGKPAEAQSASASSSASASAGDKRSRIDEQGADKRKSARQQEEQDSPLCKEMIQVEEDGAIDEIGDIAIDLTLDGDSSSESSDDADPGADADDQERVGKFLIPKGVSIDKTVIRRKPANPVGVALCATSNAVTAIDSDDRRALRSLRIWPKTAGEVPVRTKGVDTTMLLIADDCDILDVLADKCMCENAVKLRLPIVTVSEASRLHSTGAFRSPEALRTALAGWQRRLAYTDGSFALRRYSHEKNDLRAAVIICPLRETWREADFSGDGENSSAEVVDSAFSALVTLVDLGLVHESPDQKPPVAFMRKFDICDYASTPAKFAKVLKRWFRF